MSDFYDEHDFFEGLRIANSKHDMVALRLYDPSEQKLPNFGLVKMFDAEKGLVRWVNTSSKRVFFFQAEDGIRDGRVTGVQTCALPIFFALAKAEGDDATLAAVEGDVKEIAKRIEDLEFRRMFADPMDPNNCFVDINAGQGEIGRASCRKGWRIRWCSWRIKTKARRRDR